MSGFFDMGGYGLYVWGSYAAGALVYAWNLLQPWFRRRELREARRDER